MPKSFDTNTKKSAAPMKPTLANAIASNTGKSDTFGGGKKGSISHKGGKAPATPKPGMYNM